jgi:hypothetical protein
MANRLASKTRKARRNRKASFIRVFNLVEYILFRSLFLLILILAAVLVLMAAVVVLRIAGNTVNHYQSLGETGLHTMSKVQHGTESKTTADGPLNQARSGPELISWQR